MEKQLKREIHELTNLNKLKDKNIKSKNNLIRTLFNDITIIKIDNVNLSDNLIISNLLLYLISVLFFGVLIYYVF